MNNMTTPFMQANPGLYTQYAYPAQQTPYVGGPNYMGAPVTGPAPAPVNPAAYTNFNGTSYYGGNPAAANYGYVIPTTFKGESILENEERNLLTNRGQVKLDVSPEQFARKMCDHKHETGAWAATMNQNGELKCAICGAQFNLIKTDKDTCKQIISQVNGLWETTKFLSTNNNREAMRQVGTAIAILENVLPHLHENALKSWNGMYNANMRPNQVYGNNLYNNYNTADALAGLTSGGMNPYYPRTNYGYGYPVPMQTPAMGGAFYNPVATQMPMAQQAVPMTGAPVAPGANPFCNNMPVAAPQYAPAQSPAMQMPAQQVPAQQQNVTMYNPYQMSAPVFDPAQLAPAAQQAAQPINIPGVQQAAPAAQQPAPAPAPAAQQAATTGTTKFEK